MLDLEYDITNLRGAEYNPRFIGDEDIDVLAKSIETLGMVKPLIVRGDLLVAGHQRTKALRRMGVTKAPVYRLPTETTTYDEVRFNQLHNGTDLDRGDEAAVIPVPLKLGYNIVPGECVEANWKATGAGVRKAICDLINRFGSWGGVVAVQETGEVIHCGQYAMAAATVMAPLTVYAVPEARRKEYAEKLGRAYGVFDYKNIQRETYVQSLAQKFRNIKGERKQTNSTLYRERVWPWLQEHDPLNEMRILDFGAGQGDSAAWMRRKGCKLWEVELFRRIGGGMEFDKASIHRMINSLCGEISKNGLFDVVVCDSVLNSVDTKEAEVAVTDMITAFTKPGGQLFFSGRGKEDLLSKQKATRDVGEGTNVWFLDEHGFTGLYRSGRWFFQMFHSKEQIMEIVGRLGLQEAELKYVGQSWHVIGKVPDFYDEDRVRAAIKFEFELPLPDGPIGRSDDVEQAYFSAKKWHQERAESVTG